MKKIKNLIYLCIVTLASLTLSSCGGDDDGNNGGATGGDLISKAIGTWMCIQSTDQQGSNSYQSLMVGKEITIYANGTYTSTSSSFGYAGTYSVSGNKITAHSNSGGTFVITVTFSGEKMSWSGTANNGVTFYYIFDKESSSTSTTQNFTKDLIAGDFSWKVKNIAFEQGSSSSIAQDKVITFKEDGTCVGFLSMENAWRINSGRIETYYASTNEPMYIYTFLSKNDAGDELTVRINGTLDDNLQATVVLGRCLSESPISVTTEESVFGNKGSILAVRNVCYASCAEFGVAQYKLEKIRLNTATVHNITPLTNEIKNAWQSAYKTINNINTMLEHSTQIASVLSETETTELIAQLKGLRAFVYYNIAMLWGNVPLVTQPITTDASYSLTQSTQATVLQFAYNEISNAIYSLPEGTSDYNSKITFTRNAGRMLLAEVAISLGYNSQASSTLNQMGLSSKSVITGSPNSDDIWSLAISESSYLPIYTSTHLTLFKNEAAVNTSNLETEWKTALSDGYGYWAALKRLGKAQPVTGCYDYELLMPIPSAEIMNNHNIKQNPGY